MLYNGKQSHGSASATEEEMSKAKDVGEQKEYKTKGNSSTSQERIPLHEIHHSDAFKGGNTRHHPEAS